MQLKILRQLQDFTCLPEVRTLYSSIHKLQQTKLEGALRIRGLSLEGDVSALRIRLLQFEVQFYHPQIDIPWRDGQIKISKEDATELQTRVNALYDLAHTLCVERIDVSLAHANQATQSTKGPKTSSNASTTNDDSHKDTATENNQVKYRLNCLKLLKLCNLQYSGVRGLPARKFLENLEDFRIFSKISERALLETIPCALDFDTKKWYRANNFTSWQSFERKFVEDFVNLPNDTKSVKQQTDNTTQTDNSSVNKVSDEITNRVVAPCEKCIALRMPVSKTLQDLKNSLSSIGLKTIDRITTSKKSNVIVVSNLKSPTSSARIKAPAKAKIVNNTTGQTSDVSKTIGGCSAPSFSLISNKLCSIPENSVNVVFNNNNTPNAKDSILASTAGDKPESTVQYPRQMNPNYAVQAPIIPQAKSFPPTNIVSSAAVPIIAVNPTIRNLAIQLNSNPNVKPTLIVVKSQAVVTQNNSPANYTTTINSVHNLQSFNNNIVSDVSQGQITYHPKPADNVSQILHTLSPTNAHPDGTRYLLTRHGCNVANLTNQPLNYGFGTYHYPMDYYVPNGFRHC